MGGTTAASPLTTPYVDLHVPAMTPDRSPCRPEGVDAGIENGGIDDAVLRAFSRGRGGGGISNIGNKWRETAEPAMSSSRSARRARPET